MTTTAVPATATWVEVCSAEAIVPDTGVCALVAGEQVAVFRLADGSVHAIANLDPFSGVPCLSRGIVGETAGAPTVASPVYKQRFDLRTGACLDDPEVRVPAHAARCLDGRIEVALLS